MSNKHSPQGALPTVTLLMPCLNEVKTIGSCVTKAKQTLEKYEIPGEVVVSDNGSVDGSQSVATQAGARVIHAPIRGYGGALINGIAASNTDFIIMGDADESYDWCSINVFYDKLCEGYDLVMGCRFPSKGGSIRSGAMPFLHRWLGNPVLSFLGRVLFNSSISDFHCGMRGFSKSKIEKLNLITTGMEFASEMIIKSQFAKLKTTEVPITLYPDKRDRPPHLRTWSDGWRHLRFMLLHSPKWLFTIPGCIALFIGALGLSTIIPVLAANLAVELSQERILICSFLGLAGVQWILFGLSARIYGMNHGFLPQDQTLTSIFRFIKLETGCCLGLLISVGGLALLLHLASQESEVETLKGTIAALTLLALGLQTILFSFFFSMLGLNSLTHPHR